MSVITRLFTLLAAFVMGIFLTYLLQLTLLPTDTEITSVKNTRSKLPTLSETPSVEEVDTTATEQPEPKPASDKPFDSEKDVDTALLATNNDSLPSEENKQGTSSVVADKPEEDAYELVIIKSGDSLSKIAIRYYDNQDLAYSIYEANRDLLKSPDHLVPGMELKVPVNPGEH